MNNRESTLSLLFIQLRPRQWIKNLLIFAAPIFSITTLDLEDTIYSILTFLLFSILSSCVYIINDYIDLEADRSHPTKKYRPMASGLLDPKLALRFASVLFVITLLVGLLISNLLLLVLISYFLLNLAYSVKLKTLVIVDIMSIATGFVLRAIAGGVAIDVHFTPWFLLCTMLLALFLAISKRRCELLLIKTNTGDRSTRKVLSDYSIYLLDQLNVIVLTSTIMSYSLFTFTSSHTNLLMLTIPMVLYGIFRYLFLIHVKEEGEAPEKVLLNDKHILFTAIIYAISVIIIIFYFDYV